MVHATGAYDVTVTYLLAMQELRVQVPLGALDFRVWESLVFRVLREHEIAGSNPAILTEKYRWADVGVRGWLLTTYEETLRRFDSCCRC